MLEILPSILSADFARLGEDIHRVETAGIRMLHVDVMDGHFVPNITLGPPVVASIRKFTKLSLDVHLMITHPDHHIPAFIEAGANFISVHQEACTHLDRTLRMIQTEGAEAGVVLNPATPVSTLDDILDVVDYVLIMSVNPGFGGQQFIARSLDKVRQLVERRSARGLSFAIEIDGGANLSTIAGIARAGVDWVVAGSSVFGAPDPAEAVRSLRAAASDALAVHV